MYKISTNEFGDKFYHYPNGKLHRLTGPAIEYSNGDKSYYVDDMLHRLDGPALIRQDQTPRYFIYGFEVTEIVIKNLRGNLWNTV